ncbi:MAG: TonB-dependent receptor [Burkholderiaceae bacterium]
MGKRSQLARRKRIAVGTSAAGLLLAGTTAAAQTADTSQTQPPTQPQTVERVEITGSSIKRIDAETALPVEIITRKDIERSGVQNTEDLMKLITVTQSGGNFVSATAAGSTTSSVETVSLRGLGPQRTLVLIDGRRSTIFGGIPDGGGDTAVDIGSLPLAAIERIEVLKDGASAIYGSDAVAGVINIILRKDYVGGEVTVMGGDSQHGGASSQSTNAVVGFGNLDTDGFNVSLDASFTHQQALTGAQRPFSKTSWNGDGNSSSSTNSFPANVFTPGGTGFTNPHFPNCGPSFVDPVFNTPGVLPGICAFNTGPYVDLIPESDKGSVFANVHFKVDADNQLYAQFGFNDTATKVRIQPSPISEDFALPANDPYNAYFSKLAATQYPGVINPDTGAPYTSLTGFSTLLLPPSSPYYPAAFAAANGLAGQPLNVAYRTFITGQRQLTDESQLYRLVLGAKGTFAGWDYDTGFLYTQSNVTERTDSGFFSSNAFGQLFDQGLINPFGLTAPAGQAAAQSTIINATAFTSQTSITSFDAHASRDIYSLPSGNITLAVGGEVREEKYELQTSQLLQIGDLSGYGGDNLPVNRQRYVEGLFAESVIPILKTLEGDLAVRYDNYEGVGDTVNPKASIRWQPTPEFLFRASAGSGFRAPQLTELYAPNIQNVTVSNTSDPLKCPVPGGPSNCNTQFTTILGGNSALKPEKSVQESVGGIWEPNKNLSFGVDIFQINLRDTILIGGVPYTYFLQNAALANEFSYLINRGANGSIVSINQTNINLGRSEVNGADIDFKWRFLAETADKLTFTLNSTYYNRFNTENPDGSYTNNIAQGNIPAISTTGGIIARWRSNEALTWDHGPWSATLSNSWQSSYNDFPSNVTGTPRRVSSYSIFNLEGSYSGIKNVVIRAGINNLLDTDPPYTNSTQAFQIGYDPTYANPIGRYYYLAMTYKFL